VGGGPSTHVCGDAHTTDTPPPPPVGNLTGITIAQSDIAADLDAYEYTTWFISITLTVSSALSPLSSRLATIFSPTVQILPTAVLLALGSLVSGAAPSLPVFLLGRTFLGIGGAGVITLGMVLVLELSSPRRRGLWIGVLHTAYTSGIAVGAILFGSLLGVIGWVCLPRGRVF
jgi:MFS family permease